MPPKWSPCRWVTRTASIPAGSSDRVIAGSAALPQSRSSVVAPSRTTMQLSCRLPGADALPVPRNVTSTLISRLPRGLRRLRLREVVRREPQREDEADDREERERLRGERAERDVLHRIEQRAELLGARRDDRVQRRAEGRDADRSAERPREVEEARDDAAPAVADRGLHRDQQRWVHHALPEPDARGREDEQGERRLRRESREERRAPEREERAGDDRPPHPDAHQEPPRGDRADRPADAHAREREARLDRRPREDALRERRHERRRAELEHAHEQAERETDADERDAEEREVDERLRGAALDRDEDRRERDRARERGERQRAVHAEEEERGRAGERRRARPVDRSAAVLLALMEREQEGERDEPDRQVHVEGPAPRERLRDDAADRGSDERGGRHTPEVKPCMRPRCRASKRSPIIVMPVEMSAPAPRPWSARNAMSWSIVALWPQSIDAPTNTTSATRYTRLRPWTSAKRPNTGVVAVEASRYAAKTHE